MRLILQILVIVCLLSTGCAPESTRPPAEEGFGVVWGAASVGEQCVAPLMGAQGLPVEGDPLFVDRVLVRLEDLIIDGDPKTRQRTFQYAQAQLTPDNYLLVDQITADTDFNLRIAGCRDGQAEPLWSGFSRAIRVGEFEKIVPSIFITTEAALSCPSEKITVGNRTIGESSPGANAAFSTVLATPEGHFLIAGGVAPDGSTLNTTGAISLFHTGTGSFFTLAGSLGTARAMADGALIGSIGDQKIAIFGGAPSLLPSAGKTEHPYLYPGPKGEGFSAQNFVEILDPNTGASTSWTVPTGLDGEDQKMPALASTYYAEGSDTLFVVGGYGSVAGADPQALVENNLFVIPGMKTLVGAEEGVEKSASISSLQNPRVGAVLLESLDGGVVAFGGNSDGVAENIAEWIPSDGSTSSTLTVESPSALPAMAFSSAFLLSATDSKRSYLVVGGIPATQGQYPTSAIENQGGFAGIVRIGAGANAPTIAVEVLDLGVHAQRVFSSAFRINENKVGLAGGLVALTEVPDFPEDLCVDGVIGQCTRNDLTVFSWVGDQVEVERVADLNLGATIGASSASLAGGGVLFTAGLHSLEDQATSDDRQPVIWNPLLTTEANLCPLEICGDGEQKDEDLDGLANCADPECAGQGPCGGTRQ